MTRVQRDYTKQAITLRPELSEVSRGRAFLVEEATAAGFSAERVFDIAVACSEAMANAIEHSPVKGAVLVRALLYADRLEVEIEGPGEFQAPDRLKERGSRGLGLPLMAKLSDYLALFSGPDGQTFVSLTFYRPGVTPRPRSAFPPSFSNLSQENKLLDDVLRHLPDGFYVLDDDWRFLYVNPALVDPLRLSPEDLLGTVIWETFPDFDPAARSALETAKYEGSVARVVASSGGLWREWTAFPVEEGLAVYSRDITERRQAEQALENLRFVLSEAQRIAHVGSFEYVAETRTTIWSDEECRIYGLAPGSQSPPYDEMLEKFIHPDDAALLHETFSRAMETLGVYELEHRIVRPDGTERVVYDRAQPYLDERGDLIRYVGATVDVTERKQAEEALRASEERFRLALKNAPISLAAMDRDLRYVWAYNQRTATPEEVIGRTDEDLFPQEAKRLTRLKRRLIRTGREAHGGMWITRPGRRMFLDLHMEPMRDEAGSVIGLWITSVDLTAQKQAEAKLLDLSEQRQVALDAASLGWWYYDPVVNMSTWDRRYKEIFGVPEDSRPNDEILKRIHPEDLPGVWARVEAALDPTNPQPYSAEYRILLPDGSLRWIEAYGMGTFKGEGAARQATSLVGTVEDVTHRKKAEEALEFQAELLANVHDPMTGTDENFIITYWNEAAERLFGWTAEEVVGRPAAEVLKTRLPDTSREKALAELSATGHFRGDVYYTRKDGTEVPAEVRTALLRRADGTITGTISVQRDITERKAAETGREESLRRERELAGRLVVVNAELRAQADELSRINSELQAQTKELRVQSDMLAASEARYRGLVEQAVDGIFLADEQGRYLDANSAGLRMLGYTVDEIHKVTLLDVLVPDETARLPEQMSSLSSGAVVINEWQFRRKDGSTFTGELVGRQLPDGRLMGILRDVTDRRRGDEALRESERRLKRSQEIAHLGSWELDLVKDELSWSDEVYRIFGLEPQEFGATYEAFLEHVHPDDRRKVDEAYSGSLLENHDTYEIEHRVVRRDGGEIRYVHEKCQHIRDLEGRVIRSIGMVHDITDRVLVEEALRSNQERTRTFLQVANAISQWTDLSSVLEASLQAVVKATAHKRATIALWDGEHQQMRMLASSGAEPMSLSTAALAEFSLPFQEVIHAGKMAVVDYDNLPEEQRRMAVLRGTRNALIVPLIFRERVNGVVFVDDPGEWVPFSDDERLLVEGIAAQAGVAMENARLYDAQKAIADQLQNAIVSMPTEVPGVEFSHLYHSATEEAIVGGDFYDVFSQRDGTIVMLAGDVSGHGVNAARVATMVKASLAAFAHNGGGPSAVLENANQLLLRKGLPGFTSVLYAVYDPSDAVLRYCAAGHPNLLTGHPDTGAEFVGTNHLPLGVFPDWSCSADTLHVRSGQTLLFYTDGLTEARAGATMYGEERLAHVFMANLDLPISELPEAILYDVLRYTRGRLKDDAAVLAVRILP